MNEGGNARPADKTNENAAAKTLVDLMLEKEVGKISVKELTQKADVNRSTFYLHYLDIYDMLEQMENEFVETIQGFFHDFLCPCPHRCP